MTNDPSGPVTAAPIPAASALKENHPLMMFTL